MITAIACRYPASIGAFGCFLLRTHSIQLRICAVVSGSLPVLASVDTFAAISVSDISGSRFADIPIALA